MFAPRPPPQIGRRNIIPDRQSRHCGSLPQKPQNLPLQKSQNRNQRNQPRESAPIQLGIISNESPRQERARAIDGWHRYPRRYRVKIVIEKQVIGLIRVIGQP